MLRTVNSSLRYGRQLYFAPRLTSNKLAYHNGRVALFSSEVENKLDFDNTVIVTKSCANVRQFLFLRLS
jgi:hypothetical protein